MHVNVKVFNNWFILILYVILTFLVVHNGPKFAAILFEKLCVDLEVLHLTWCTY